MYGRRPPHIHSFVKSGGSRDDEIHIVCPPLRRAALYTYHSMQNTQSGSQWDGLKHFPIKEGGPFVLYKG